MSKDLKVDLVPFEKKLHEFLDAEYLKELQTLKDAIEEHNEGIKWWQFWKREWRLNENFLFFSVCYDGFPNPLNLHKTMYGLSWTGFPKKYNAILKPEHRRR